jgi:hypothetical protein
MTNRTHLSAPQLDLSRAVVCASPRLDRLGRKTAQVLVEEVEKRTRICWQIVQQGEIGDTPVILLDVLDAATPTHSADGFQIRTRLDQAAPTIHILGNDSRGLLYGVGFLLRHLEMTRGRVLLPAALAVTTAPKYSLRGHQLGYRDKTNSYDGWDTPQWDQYMRELALFGTNAIELIPPRSDDRLDSVHFPLPPLEMMASMSAIADSYGLDVWVWHPALDDDYSRPEMVEFALAEWEAVYRRLPRVDAILVPGGDPGNTRPRLLLPMLAKQKERISQFHPNVQLWISAQGFSDEWLDEFLTILRTESPDWLAGVVYGPWCHMTIADFRRLIPARYPIRSYPDITHSLDCQYPVPDWDIAFALTEGRETINPRPRDQQVIFQQMGEEALGFLTYSEGCNDDVNKFIWSGLGWDPQTDVVEILRQYSRLFIAPEHADDFALGLLALERNWRGPLATNIGVLTTLRQFQMLEQAASPALLKNWRFQQALYRTYYDAYTRSRLLYESGLEVEAWDRLRAAPQLGALAAMGQAEAILERAASQPIAATWRTRIFQLAEALFQSIHMQLSVPLYRAQSETRGANLDGLDFPLNDAPWLRAEFARIRKLDDETERQAEIARLLDWCNPGPGGSYLDLSNAYDCPNLRDRLPYEADPGFYRSPHRRFPYWKDPRPIRRAWRGYTGCLKDFPLRLHFPALDPQASYRVRVVYSDVAKGMRLRLTAMDAMTNEVVEIHPFMVKPTPPTPLEFDIPPAAVRHGELTLSLQRAPGLGGLGAGHEISEIWIMKK